jgi:hypothetical protein
MRSALFINVLNYVSVGSGVAFLGETQNIYILQSQLLSWRQGMH